MSHIIQYPVPFDILDAAVNECLKGYCNWGTYQRVPVTPASTTYKLTGNRDEDLGVVHVRKVGERLTELCLARPPNVRLKPTPEQRADAGGWRAWREAEKAQNRDRWSYVQTVYSALCSRLADDGMWDEVLQREAAGAVPAPEQPASNGEALPPASQKKRDKLGTQGGTLDRVREARELVESGVPKTTACKRARIDSRTYDRYVADFINWSLDDKDDE